MLATVTKTFSAKSMTFSMSKRSLNKLSSFGCFLHQRFCNSLLQHSFSQLETVYSEAIGFFLFENVPLLEHLTTFIRVNCPVLCNTPLCFLWVSLRACITKRALWYKKGNSLVCQKGNQAKGSRVAFFEISKGYDWTATMGN